MFVEYYRVCSMKKILIIVLNWNGIDDTEACIKSLLQQTYEKYDILVIDNGSIDGSVERIKKIAATHPIIKTVFNPHNLGFAGGVNTGIKFALNRDYEAVALCNNDAIFDTDWLKNLEKNLTADTMVVTGLLLHKDGKTIDSTGDFYSSWGIGFPRNRGQVASKAEKSGYVFSGSGGASLYSLDLFRKIGLFDESFFAYYEDTDISFRAQLAGFKIYYEKSAIAYHKQGATSGKIPGFTVYQTFKNLPLLFWKNIPTPLIPYVGSRFLLLYGLIFIHAFKKGSGFSALKGLVLSIWLFWTKALWSRLHIQRSRVRSSSEIKNLLYHDLPPEQTGMRRFRSLFIRPL